MKTLKLIKKVAPEINEILERRYLILRGIQQNQPIGRRTLATELGFKERTVRDEVAILKKQELLDVDFTGTYITEKGHKLLDDLHEIYNHLKGIPQLEEELRKLLKIKKVIIVPGNSSENRMVLKDMGKITFKELKNNISSKDIIGITGGNTMASVVEEAVYDKKERDILVIPARGGLGRNLNTQSNSIAAKLAEGLGGSYRLLYIPDALEEEALEYILKNEEISHSLNLINNMNTLVFGIGRADIMAKRRNLSEGKIKELEEKGAVAEAFGHYFNIDGEEVWEYKTIGLSLERFKRLESLIGVAGGEEKAQAILSVATLNQEMVLITDEADRKSVV